MESLNQDTEVSQQPDPKPPDKQDPKQETYNGYFYKSREEAKAARRKQDRERKRQKKKDIEDEWTPAERIKKKKRKKKPGPKPKPKKVKPKGKRGRPPKPPPIFKVEWVPPPEYWHVRREYEAIMTYRREMRKLSQTAYNLTMRCKRNTKVYLKKINPNSTDLGFIN